MSSADVLIRLTWASLALAGAITLVAVLRRPWMRLFGARQTLGLWWLPCLAIVGSQWSGLRGWSADPYPVPFSGAALMTSISVAASHGAQDVSGLTSWLVGTWLTGAGLGLAVLVVIQWRFERCLSRESVDSPSVGPRHCRVLRARHNDIGPALVGFWRARIVVPFDFESRYTPEEQSLILAHEVMHAERRDGITAALAALLTAVFWFHPMAWWACLRFRKDQELACDAQVLSRSAICRRTYATAMLKTQVQAHSCPVGCSWTHGKTIKERLAMLKSVPPNRPRRTAGQLLLVLSSIMVTGLAVAASPVGKTFRPDRATVQSALRIMDGAKTGVAQYTFTHHWKKPADNAEAGLDAPTSFHKYSSHVARLDVRYGVIDVALLDASAHPVGDLRLVPDFDAKSERMAWICDSPNIPDIRKLEPACRYRPGISAR